MATRRSPTVARQESLLLGQRIEYNAWDGEWYRRAYFDDGTPLGSNGNEECRIDSIAQSWSVLSGAGDGDRSRQAMEAVHERLVRRDGALVQLLDPPFDKSALDPGYIRGYVPGVRENGGQYTHAAVWAAMAFAALGDGARAWELTAMINPVNHALTDEGARRYMVEPYVVAADVYALPPHTGRGGWTWYTGSAGWMYRLVVESLLGLNREADHLRLAPCLHPEWEGFAMRYRFGGTLYHHFGVPERDRPRRGIWTRQPCPSTASHRQATLCCSWTMATSIASTCASQHDFQQFDRARIVFSNEPSK